MKIDDETHSHRLLIVMAAMMLAFLGSSIYANWRTLAIDSEAEGLAEDALPDIEHTSAATDALHRIEAAADEYPSAPASEREQAKKEIQLALSSVDGEMAAYLALPSVENERIRRGDLRAALGQVHEAVQALFEEVDLDANPAHLEAAVRRVRVAVVRVTESLREVMRFSATEARALIGRISQIRRSASHAAIALNGLSLFLGVVAALWVRRFFRRHDSLAKTHARFLERRANELELFAQRVAHDLLSPLSALVFCLGAFQRASESDPKLSRALTQARGCVARARSMVDGIFEFAKAGAAPERGARCEVGDVIAQIAEEVRATDRTQRPELEIDVLGQPAVACSHGVLVSVLTNLMQNAVKFMNDAPIRRVVVRVRDEAPNVRIEVEDTGPGIAPELRAVLFEPYVRGQGATQAGLGLGLATVKKLCEAHGGRVGVRSGFEGSTFWVLLPSAPSPASLAPSSAVAPVREAG